MKKKLTYILLLISLAAALVSCREIEVSVAASGDAIHVRAMVAEGPGTRGVATGTSLPTEATMYLSADHNGTGASGNYFSNVPFTASGSTWSPQSGSYYWPLSGNLELLGFCNYGPTDFSSSATRTNATAISVSSSDWTNNDMMFGAATGAPASGTTMAFRHALAQVKFTARMTVDGSINLKSITFNGIKGATLSCSKSFGSASLTVNSSTSGYSSSTVTAFSGTQALTSTATAAGSPVLMPDQTITSITVTYASVSGGVEGTAETVTKPVSQALTKGYAYTFALTVESQGVRFDISVTPWNTNPINIGEFPYEDPVYTFGGLMISPGPLTYSGGTFALEDDWNHDSNNSIYGTNEGSYYFNWVQLGKYFDSHGTSFSIGDRNSIDNNGSKVSWGGYDDWRLPTLSEWSTIVTTSAATRPGSTVNGASNKHYALIQLTGIIHAGGSTPYGLLLFPDGNTITGKSLSGIDNTTITSGVSGSELDTFLQQGCVFLPCSGYVTSTNYGDTWNGNTQGQYYSATYKNYQNSYHYCYYLLASSYPSISPSSYCAGNNCYLTVRLVRNIE